MSSREENRARIAEGIIRAYDFRQPLHMFLKNFFRQNKQFGSSDRRMLRALSYAWFRLGGACQEDAFILRLLKAFFLCEEHAPSFIQYWALKLERPELLEHMEAGKVEKLQLLGIEVKDLFPLLHLVDEALDRDALALAQLQQPLLWIRCLPGREETVKKALTDAGCAFLQQQQAIGLPNATDLEKLDLLAGVDYEVQDISSQQSLSDVQLAPAARVWDCCAASGGKSLLLHAHHPQAQVYVSDNRESILQNMRHRFRQAGIKQYHYLQCDLQQPAHTLTFTGQGRDTVAAEADFFDMIVLDAPCSGSGTWARTPERISQFKVEEIEAYSKLQLQIAEHVIPFLKPGGQLLYITCSVFDAENRQQVKAMSERYALRVRSVRNMEGYGRQADTMFVALLEK